MKKILLTMAFVLTALGNAWADDDVTVGDITIPQGSINVLKISLDNPDNEYRQLFQMDLVLPTGIKVYSVQLTNRFNSSAQVGFNEVAPQTFRLLCQSGLETSLISKTSGVIANVQLKADPSLTEGTESLTGTLMEIEVTDQNSQKFRPAAKSFNITIGSPRDAVELWDENEANLAKQTNVDILVHRIILSDQWSTLCVPFNMAEAQVKEAFGDGVAVADLKEWSCEGLVFNEDEQVSEVNKIDLVFDSVKSIKALHPYLIKVSKEKGDLDSFIAQYVSYNRNPSPEDYIVTDDDGNSCIMSGVFKMGYVPKYGVFLSQNKFWRAKDDDTSRIKAFRAYFQFEDEQGYPIIISEANASRITMSFNEDATKIKDVRASEDDGSIYNLSGQKVERLNKKGLYIKGGKKVVIK